MTTLPQPSFTLTALTETYRKFRDLACYGGLPMVGRPFKAMPAPSPVVRTRRGTCSLGSRAGRLACNSLETLGVARSGFLVFGRSRLAEAKHYREQADLAQTAADEATLPRIQQQFAASALRWTELAERAEAHERRQNESALNQAPRR